MTKRRKEFREYLIKLVIYAITGFAMLMLIVTLLIINKGNKEIAISEANLEITSCIGEYSVHTEYIPVKEMMSSYIDTLPIPEIEVVNIEQDVANENNQEERESEILETANNELSKMVEGITPIIRNLNTSSYCQCEKCCEKTDGITASGEKATAWHTVAAGKDYKIGTIIYIPELANMPNGGWFIVQDRGGAISNDKLDIYLNTHSEALQYGRKTLECYIYEF